MTQKCGINLSYELSNTRLPRYNDITRMESRAFWQLRRTSRCLQSLYLFYIFVIFDICVNYCYTRISDNFWNWRLFLCGLCNLIRMREFASYLYHICHFPLFSTLLYQFWQKFFICCNNNMNIRRFKKWTQSKIYVTTVWLKHWHTQKRVLLDKRYLQSENIEMLK